MTKITLEPRKTTRVPFIYDKAKMKTEHRLHIQFYGADILTTAARMALIRYSFTGLTSGKPIPASQLIIKEKGLPQTIAQTEPSAMPDKFNSQWVDDPLVEIMDRVSKVEQTKFEEKKLSNRVIERVREDTVTRAIRMVNKTGKPVTMKLEIEDAPASGLQFVSAEPSPTTIRAPEYIWEFSMAKEEERIVLVKFNFKRTERIELPADARLGVGGVYPSPAAASPAQFEDNSNDVFTNQGLNDDNTQGLK